MKKKQPKGFKKAKKRTESLLHHTGKLGKLISKAQEKASKKKKQLKNVQSDLFILIRLVIAWKSGNYREIPWKTIVYAGTALLYFVNPFDIVPDFIPIAGFLDDITIITFVVKSIQQDIKQFKNWEKNQ